MPIVDVVPNVNADQSSVNIRYYKTLTIAKNVEIGLYIFGMINAAW